MRTRLLNVLLVEDNDDHAELIRMSLAKKHFCSHIWRASDGEEALGKLRGNRGLPVAERCDLVLLDINLPGKSGLDVLKEIKDDPFLRSTVVIMLTTSDAEKDRALAYHRHANSYIEKPVDFDQFIALMDDFADYWGKWNRNPAT